MSVLPSSSGDQEVSPVEEPPKPPVQLGETQRSFDPECLVVMDVPGGGSPILNPLLARQLKNHQAEGVKFICSHIFKNAGCILSDFMGLGKTFQLICSMHAFMSYGRVDPETGLTSRHISDLVLPDGRTLPKTVVLSPAIVVRNWEAEFKKFVPPAIDEVLKVIVLDAGTCTNMDERLKVLRKWDRTGGILLMGYELFRILCGSNDPDVQEQTMAFLCNPGPDLIVLDEGHRIKDNKTKLAMALANVATRRRVVMTGYPLQNHLVEYYCMVEFASPGILGDKKTFINNVVKPVNTAKENPKFKYEAMRKLKALTTHLKPIALRRDVSYLKRVLPPKHEWVIKCRLSPIQSRLYKHFLRYRRSQSLRFDLDDEEDFEGDGGDEEGGGKRKKGKKLSRNKDILAATHITIMIVNHPDVLNELVLELNKQEDDWIAEGNTGLPEGMKFRPYDRDVSTTSSVFQRRYRKFLPSEGPIRPPVPSTYPPQYHSDRPSTLIPALPSAAPVSNTPSLFYNPADFTPLVLPIHRAIVEGSYALRLNLLTVKLSGIEACIVKEIMSGASPSVIESCRPGDLILDVKSGFEAMISVAPRPFATGFPRLQDIKVLLSQIHTPDLVLFVQRPKTGLSYFGPVNHSNTTVDLISDSESEEGAIVLDDSDGGEIDGSEFGVSLPWMAHLGSEDTNNAATGVDYDFSQYLMYGNAEGPQSPDQGSSFAYRAPAPVSNNMPSADALSSLLPAFPPPAATAESSADTKPPALEGLGSESNKIETAHEATVELPTHADDSAKAAEIVNGESMKQEGAAAVVRNVAFEEDTDSDFDLDLEKFIEANTASDEPAKPASITVKPEPETPAAPESDDDVEIIEAADAPTQRNHGLAWAWPVLESYTPGEVEASTKMIVAMSILSLAVRNGERTSIFSQSLGTLTALQKAISAYNDSAPKEYHLHALKIDGSTSLVNRFKMIQRFNDPRDKINVMLMSTRAGSEGVNLVGGNRMILFDVCWNPSHDRQAMCRSYRFGQIRPTYVYRLVAAGTVESKILDLQMSKEKLARTIIDDVMTSTALEGDFDDFFDMDALKESEKKAKKMEQARQAAKKKKSASGGGKKRSRKPKEPEPEPEDDGSEGSEPDENEEGSEADEETVGAEPVKGKKRGRSRKGTADKGSEGKQKGKRTRRERKEKKSLIDVDDKDDAALWRSDSEDDFDYDAEIQPIVNAEEDPLLATVLKRCHGMVIDASKQDTLVDEAEEWPEEELMKPLPEVHQPPVAPRPMTVPRAIQHPGMVPGHWNSYGGVSVATNGVNQFNPLRTGVPYAPNALYHHPGMMMRPMPQPRPQQVRPAPAPAPAPPPPPAPPKPAATVISSEEGATVLRFGSAPSTKPSTPAPVPSPLPAPIVRPPPRPPVLPQPISRLPPAPARPPPQPTSGQQKFGKCLKCGAMKYLKRNHTPADEKCSNCGSQLSIRVT